MFQGFAATLTAVLTATVLISTLVTPVSDSPANAAVPQMRQTNYLSPTANVSSRSFGSSVATDAAGTRMAIGESGSGGVGGDVNVYDCTSSGCSLTQALNSLATRSVSITQITITDSGRKATATTSTPHGFLPGEKITISGTGNSTFTVTNREISDVTTSTISFGTNSSNLAATQVSGTGVVDLASTTSAFGTSVDISDDGNLILVGAPSASFTYYQYTNYSTGAGSNVNRVFGRAYLFEFISGAWALAKVFDRAVPAHNDRYGRSVALSGDGSTAVISSYASSDSVANNAEILVNTPNPSASPGPSGVSVLYSAWVLQQTVSELAIGTDVDISDTGAIIVFAANAAASPLGSGRAYIYTKNQSTWTKTKTLAKSDISNQTLDTNDAFGWSVAVSDDGSTVAVTQYQGASPVYLYRYSGSTWGTPTNIKPATLGSRDVSSIALSADGNVAMIGMREEDIGCYSEAGAVAFMEFTNNAWGQTGGLRTLDSPATNSYFGDTVAMSEDGSSFAVTGSPSRSVGGVFSVGGITTFASFTSITDSQEPSLTLQQGCTNGSLVVQTDPTTVNSIKFELVSNESLDVSTVTSVDFTITNGTFSSVSCSSTYCTITVTASAVGAVTIAPSGSFSVGDTQGNLATTAGGSDRSVTFDNAAPTLTSSTPIDNATSVDVAGNIVLNFSENVVFQASTTISIIRIRPSPQTANSAFESFATASVRVTGSGTSTITIDPTTDLLAGYEYYLSIPNGTFKDVAGNSYAGLTTTSALSFTVTPDTTLPTLTSSTPLDNGLNFSHTGNILLNFSEDIYSGSGNLLLKKLSDGSTVQSFAFNAAQLTWSNNILTVNPTADLLYSTEYYLEVPNTFVKDISNNFYAGLAGTTAFNFTTAADTAAPTVTALSPVNNLPTVTINQNLIVTFNEVVNQGTGTFVIKVLSDSSTFESIASNDARITGWGSNQITINPTGTFVGTVVYFVNISAGAVVDTANNAYAGITDNTSWRFTVSDTTAPLRVSMVTNAAGTSITLTFNENLSTASPPTTSQFSLSINGGTGTTPSARSVSGATVVLTPSTAINPTDVVTLTYTDSNLTTDIQDLALNDAVSFSAQTVTNLVVPKVTNVTSSTSNGTFSPGDAISIQVVFSGPVTVTGNPTLLLETGSIDRLSAYSSGSGTNTLTFSYTVQAGDGSSDLDYASTSALSLSGGTISNANGAAVLTLVTPGNAGSLGANKALVVTGGPLTLSITPSSITYTDTSINDDFTDTTGTASGVGAGTYIFGISGGTTYATNSTTPPNTSVVKYTVGRAGTYGTLWLVNTTENNFSTYNGYWRFVPNDALINALTSTVTEAFSITLDNGTNTTSNNITFTFVGVNDRPTVAIATSPSSDFSPVPTTTTCGFDTPYAVDLGESPAGETCNYAFDDQDGTKYLNFDQSSSILIDSGAVYTLTGIGMTTGNDLVSRDPVSFTVFGSNVSRTSGMTKIATITNVAAPIGRGALYPAMNFSNASSYRYYKIRWDSVRSPLDANSIQIAEIRLIGYSGGALIYTEGQPAQPVEAAFTLTDLDGQIVSSTVRISAGLTTGDVLSLVVNPATMGSISAVFNASTGLLTLTGSATSAQYQAALRAVGFLSTSTNPTELYSSRTVTWESTDSTGLKNIAVVTSIAVISINDVPVLSDLTPKSIPERAAAQLLDSAITLTDPDSPNFFEGLIKVSGLLEGDVVSLSTTTSSAAGAIRRAGLEVQRSDGNAWQKLGTISGGSGTDLIILLTTISATRASVERIIESLLFATTSSVQSRTLTITVDDGDGGTSVGGTIVVTITDATPPIVTLAPALIKNTGSAIASSNEAGKIYLVRADQEVASEAAILALVDFLWNASVDVTANTPVSIQAAGLSNGFFVAYAVDAAGNLSAASTDRLEISGSAPTAGVLSRFISPSRLTTFNFQLAFSESISGLASADFSNTGTATGCVFTPSGSTGSFFNVAVTNCSEGTLALRLVPDSVIDSSSNAGPTLEVVTDFITIDRTVPTASWTVPASPATALPLSYTLTFNEGISGLTSSDFINANLTSAKAVGCIFTPSSDTGTVITVVVTGCSDGVLTLRLRSSSVADAASNVGPISNVDATSVTIDRVAPIINWLAPITAGFTTLTSVTPNWEVFDGGSGLASSGVVSLMRATLTGETCGDFTSQGTQTKNSATTLTTGYCYYWVFSTAPVDVAGNTTSGASLTSVVLKVDTAGTIVRLIAPFSVTNSPEDQPIIFDVTFSRDITGIESADFTNAGTATGCVIAPQASSYLTAGGSVKVNVTNCSEGTLILQLAATSVFHSTTVAAPVVPFNSGTVIIDRTAPTIIVKDPTAGSSDIAVDANVVLTFSEIIVSRIGAISLRTLNGDLVQRLSVTDSQVTGFGTKFITINFDSDLARNTSYYLEIDSGSVIDISGLPFASFTGPTNLLFTTAPGLSQTITMADAFTKLSTDAAFSPGATTSSFLPIFYTTSNPAVADIVDGNVVIISAGTVVITAYQVGNGAFEAALPVTATLTITGPVTAPITPPVITPPVITPPPASNTGGVPPSIFKTVVAPKILRNQTQFICIAGTFLFVRNGFTEENPKITLQRFSLVQNGKIIESSDSLLSQAAFESKSEYLNTTLSCLVTVSQENTSTAASSIISKSLSDTNEKKRVALREIDEKYYSDRTAAYKKKDVEFLRIAEIRRDEIARAKSATTILLASTRYQKAFAAASDLWKLELQRAISDRGAARISAESNFLDSLEKAGISIYPRLVAAVVDPKPTPTPTATPTLNPQPTAQMLKVATVYMPSGSYSLDAATKRKLIAVAKSINASGVKNILVYGHADVRGDVKKNTVLSQRRATAVAAFLRPLLTSKKISIGWFASKKPVKPGTSAAALALNRRVEIFTK